MNDITEAPRMERIQEINAQIQSNDKENERLRLVHQYGTENVFDTQELGKRFEVIGFAAPFCLVVDRQTRVKGTIEFQHNPRLYFDFRPI